MKSREFGEIATFNGSIAFIRRDAVEKDVFAHESELIYEPVRRGDRVSFQARQNACAGRSPRRRKDAASPCARLTGRGVRFCRRWRRSTGSAGDEQTSNKIIDRPPRRCGGAAL